MSSLPEPLIYNIIWAVEINQLNKFEMSNQSFQYSITTSKNDNEIFAYLMNPENWWTGLFDETIEGKSKVINDEFSFRAGNGMHFSIQKLIELELDKKIVWLVTESNLSFLDKTNEWTGTRICFDIEKMMGIRPLYLHMMACSRNLTVMAVVQVLGQNIYKIFRNISID